MIAQHSFLFVVWLYENFHTENIFAVNSFLILNSYKHLVNVEKRTFKSNETVRKNTN